MQISKTHPVSDPHLVALLFEAGQLSRARELASLTKTALAKMIGKTPSAITQFESGLIRPDVNTLLRLSLALDVPWSFFARKAEVDAINHNECFFRSLRSTTKAQRTQAVRMGETLLELVHILEQQGIEFPADQLTHLKRAISHENQIDDYALEVRTAWGLGLGPLWEPISLAEASGARVFPLADVCMKVDAFSLWMNGAPIIMLAMQKAPSRTHFDVLHELGHLLMHEDAAQADPQTERQANRFASAFLLPRATFSHECPQRWSLPAFRELKTRWRVSVQALVLRAYQIEKISYSSVRRAFGELNRRRMRSDEGDEWELDRPRLLMDAITEVELPLSELASQLGLRPDRLTRLLAPLSEPTRPGPLS